MRIETGKGVLEMLTIALQVRQQGFDIGHGQGARWHWAGRCYTSLALAAALLGFFVITLDAVYRPLCLRALALVAQWQGNIDRRLPISRKPKA
jgi:hypothetical protein